MSITSLRLARLQGREQGITAVEYALMVAVVALLLVVGFYFLFTNISEKFSSTGQCIKEAPAKEGCGATPTEPAK
jgi:Flp pilus assembly pilin Flp